jgi:Spy/CpxP family protein refolding chaperone
MKKTRLFTAFLFCLLTSATFAQDGHMKQKMEQVRSLKVAFITNELSLTSDEAAKFWPVYNAFEEKQRALRKQKLGAFLDRNDDAALDKMSDKEASALLAQMEDNEEELYQLRRKFAANLKSILPPVKIIKLKKAEDDFNRKLLKQYREKGGKREMKGK